MGEKNLEEELSTFETTDLNVATLLFAFGNTEISLYKDNSEFIHFRFEGTKANLDETLTKIKTNALIPCQDLIASGRYVKAIFFNARRGLGNGGQNGHYPR